MTWVKLGEERINTDCVVRYKKPFQDRLYLIWENGDPDSYYDDPDGSLLAALDAACFPDEEERVDWAEYYRRALAEVIARREGADGRNPD